MIFELHAVQSFVPANLNRDDLGQPKECTFGGVRRARVSSQSWKRAMRESFKAETAGFEVGTRTKRAHQQIVDRQLAEDPSLDVEVARHRAAVILEAEPLGLSLKRQDDSDEVKTGQLLFFRARDLDTLAEVAALHADELDGLKSSLGSEKPAKGKVKLSKEVTAAVTRAMTTPSAAIDVALFGRMVAEMPESNVDASCQVAHAIGTHRLDSEDDFYTAVDDLRPGDTEGADMIGTVAFNSSCFYRYACIDTQQLAKNLGVEDESDPAVAAAVEAFTRAFATAIPTGKQNSFAAQNPPTAVLAVRRQSGTWNLANAFVDPINVADSVGGIDALSTRRMIDQLNVLRRQYGRATDNIAAALLSEVPTDESDELVVVESLDGIVAHLGGVA